MRAKVRDTELYFDVEGSGLVPDGAGMREKPVLFVVPGGPGGDHAGFKPAFSSLSERTQLVYLDHRGSGRSAHGPHETYTMDNHVEDIEALRRHLGLGKIGLLDVSYGGMVAMKYATLYDANLSHLILVVTAPDHRFTKRAQEILAELGTPRQQEVAERLWAGAFETDAQMREYFETLGPMYSRQLAVGMQDRLHANGWHVRPRPGAVATVHLLTGGHQRRVRQGPVPLRRHRGSAPDHRADAGDRCAARLDHRAGVLSRDCRGHPRRGTADVREQRPQRARRRVRRVHRRRARVADLPTTARQRNERCVKHDVQS